jgi:hypothetical protein
MEEGRKYAWITLRRENKSDIFDFNQVEFWVPPVAFF